MPSQRIVITAASAAFLALVALAASAPAPQSPRNGAELRNLARIALEPLPAAAPTPENPLTTAKVVLGKQLYFDPRLSLNGNVSCNSCHNLATYGVDNRAFSPGDDGRLGGRNSPTVLNAALHVAQFWDGRAADVEAQAGMPVLNPVEMAIPEESFLVERLATIPGYPEAFAAAFPDDHPALTYANIGRALGAFERTLLTPARFDSWLAGDDTALDDRELAGLDRFIGVGCVSCHDGATLGARVFRKFGLRGDYWLRTHSVAPDEGRAQQTGNAADKYVFKVASLRNVARTGPYFHDGSVATLPEAIRVMADLQLGAELSDAEVDQIAAFLDTLTGEVPRQALEPAIVPGG